MLGINLGKNKVSPQDSFDDYVLGVKELGMYADFIVINVSCPNLPGLRALQEKDTLSNLLTAVCFFFFFFKFLFYYIYILILKLMFLLLLLLLILI